MVVCRVRAVAAAAAASDKLAAGPELPSDSTQAGSGCAGRLPGPDMRPSRAA